MKVLKCQRITMGYFTDYKNLLEAGLFQETEVFERGDNVRS